MCIALVNDDKSSLVSLLDNVIFLHAGKERAFVTTKSYIAALCALLQFVAHWRENNSLLISLHILPDQMRSAIDEPQQLTIDFIQSISHCVVLGRGFGYAIACEVALKLKQIFGVYAEAFSSADFLHCHTRLNGKKPSVINIEVNDESLEMHTEKIKEINEQRISMAKLMQSFLDVHQRTAPLIILLRFYLDLENLAGYLGYEANAQPALNDIS